MNYTLKQLRERVEQTRSQQQGEDAHRGAWTYKPKQDCNIINEEVVTVSLIDATR